MRHSDAQVKEFQLHSQPVTLSSRLVFPISEQLDGSGVRVGVITTRWNTEIIDGLAAGVKEALEECKVPDDYIFETQVKERKV